mmetsp:Transcript_9809/g.36448  ORF Transcript_9809/g.36448 Transcript_9809/m.36448 type:complete len:224 (+) Transcript_9809:2141-2812(+)
MDDRCGMEWTPSERASKASLPSTAATQSRKTPLETSSTRRFLPARCFHGLRSPNGFLFGVNTNFCVSSGSKNSSSASGFQNRTCVVPYDTNKSGWDSTGEKRTPLTAGGAVWYDLCDHNMRPTLGPDLKSKLLCPPQFHCQRLTVCPSSLHTVAIRSPLASNATPMTARSPRGCFNTAIGGSPLRASILHTMHFGSKPVSPLAATRVSAWTDKHRTSSSWPRK